MLEETAAPLGQRVFDSLPTRSSETLVAKAGHRRSCDRVPGQCSLKTEQRKTKASAGISAWYTPQHSDSIRLLQRVLTEDVNHNSALDGQQIRLVPVGWDLPGPTRLSGLLAAKAVGDTVMPRLSYNSDVEKLLINVIKTLKKVKASDNRSRNKAPAIKCLDSLMQKIIDDFLEC
jgi:predicted transglutaminase-like cysteine proteinase